MDEQRHTIVLELVSMDQVERFCSELQEMKSVAPVSLHFTVALSAYRCVEYLGGVGPCYKEELDKFKAFVGDPPSHEKSLDDKDLNQQMPIFNRRRRTKLNGG
jgi:hypothetical protein